MKLSSLMSGVVMVALTSDVAVGGVPQAPANSNPLVVGPVALNGSAYA